MDCGRNPDGGFQPRTFLLCDSKTIFPPRNVPFYCCNVMVTFSANAGQHTHQCWNWTCLSFRFYVNSEAQIQEMVICESQTHPTLIWIVLLTYSRSIWIIKHLGGGVRTALNRNDCPTFRIDFLLLFCLLQLRHFVLKYLRFLLFFRCNVYFFCCFYLNVLFFGVVFKKHLLCDSQMFSITKVMAALAVRQVQFGLWVKENYAKILHSVSYTVWKNSYQLLLFFSSVVPSTLNLSKSYFYVRVRLQSGNPQEPTNIKDTLTLFSCLHTLLLILFLTLHSLLVNFSHFVITPHPKPQGGGQNPSLNRSCQFKLGQYEVCLN